MEHVVVGVLHVGSVRRLLDLVVHVVLHLGLAVTLRTLRGNQDNTVSTAGTVDGCRSSILQHVNALNVVGRNIVDVAYLHTIHDIQRVVRLGDRTTTTDTNLSGTARTTVL